MKLTSSIYPVISCHTSDMECLSVYSLVLQPPPCFLLPLPLSARCYSPHLLAGSEHSVPLVVLPNERLDRVLD